MIYRYPDVAIDLHERIINWAHWVRDRTYRGHCRSIEYRYEPERIADNDERRAEQISTPTDIRDAILIERTLAAPAFPLRSREIIKWHYVKRARPEACCRVLGIRFRAYGEEIGKAVRMLGNRLTNLDIRD